MIATITPSEINGSVTAPPSKSAMQRACALALLNKGQTIINNPGNSDDDIAAINIIRGLGADVHTEHDYLAIKSNGQIKPGKIINCRESGLSLRMFAPVIALSNSIVQLTGTGSLLKRPMHFIDEVLSLLNVKTESNNGFLPINIQGPLFPKDISVDGSSSSQYLTGLLFAFARSVNKPTVINVTNLKSKPYIDLSLGLLHHFGYDVRHDAYEKFYINPVGTIEKNITYHVEADWSSASFLLVAGAIAGTITLHGLDILSPQADKAIIHVLKNSNADIKIETSCISVTNKNILRAFQFDATDCPDLFPPLAVLAAYCNGTSVIKGVSRLLSKESDRAASLMDIFAKLGVDINIKGDEMLITGGTAVKAANISSHHDHRIAMAGAIAALRSTGMVIINDAEAVNKSYPRFYDHLKMLGAAVSLSEE